MEQHKKIAVIISASLLVIILPLTIIGIIFNIKNGGDNPNKEFFYKNKLYFYDSTSELIGIYNCTNSVCGYHKQKIDDAEYNINYFSNYNLYDPSLINNQYAFINDHENENGFASLYDVKNNKLVTNYKSYKDYGIGIVNNYYIVESLEGMYGVVQINEKGLNSVLPFTYEYIALQNDIDMEQKKLSADSFIVKKEGKWYLIDANGAEFTQGTEETIVAFNSNTYIAKNENYSIYNYNGAVKLSGKYKYLNYISTYLEVKDLNNNYYLINLNNLSLASKMYSINDETKIETKVNNDNKIEIVIDGETKETIEI